MLQVGSLQPPGHDIGHFFYKSNDPQISHLQNKLWLYKLFIRLGACFGTVYGIAPYIQSNSLNGTAGGVFFSQDERGHF